MQDIIQKISEIYLRYGIKSITMDDLARDLGISKKTIYQHFTDKKDVVRKVIHHLINTQKCGIKEVLDTDGTNAIDKLMMMTHFFAHHTKNVNISLVYDLQKYHHDVWKEIQEFRREEVYNHIMENIREGIEQGLYRDDINYEIIARIYISRLDVHQPEMWQNLDNYNPQEVFHTLFVYHIRGIANTNGHNYLEENMDKWKF